MDKPMDIQDLIMKDDGLGFGDQIACCPKCEEPFVIPFEVAFSKKSIGFYPCKNCGQVCRIS